jgi:RNA polymerase sigma-70 factor (ECF subfamily)
VENLYGDSHEALVVGLARNGDRDAFAELVRRRQDWVRGLMLRSCGDTSLADDLAQQAFLQAWRKLSQLRQVHTFGAWLKQLAINEWLQLLRKNDALVLAEDWQLEEGVSRDNPGLARDLDAALEILPGAVRLCVVLSYQENMSHGEIAAATGLPLGTVKSHIKRGSEVLRQRLSAYCEEGLAQHE